MQDLQKQVKEFVEQVGKAITRINLAALQAEYAQALAQSQSPDFWQDTTAAQTIMKRQAALEARIQPWQNLQQGLNDLGELAATGDASLQTDLLAQLMEYQQQFATLKGELKFNGPYDDHNVILSIHAGAGGTDAQDWAQMLLRMYVRWAETHHYTTVMIDQSSGEEAGIKSATLEIDGAFAFGKLKGEHGVHRLVRLSPFNADSLRQTSFAKVDILPKIEAQEGEVIDEKDLKVDVFRAGGHGGQSVNTTDSAVRVTHLPTGIVVSIQNERSQLQNKETALTILRSRLAHLQLEQHKEKLDQLKGPNQSAEWGNQIRSYVLHPYKQVKDLRSKYESSDPEAVLNGNLDPLIDAYLEHGLGES